MNGLFAMRMRYGITVLFLFPLTLMVSPGTTGSTVMDPFVRAEIYYYDWDIETRSALSPEYVRERYRIKTIIAGSDELACFLMMLDLGKLKSVSKVYKEDIRLVIDLIKKSGRRTSFFASRFNLMSEDFKAKLSIDESFRDRFESFGRACGRKLRSEGDAGP